MPTNVNVPFFKPGQDITGYVAATAINGKQFVVPVSGGRGGQPHIANAGAGAAAIGVAGHDQAVGMYVHFHVGGTVPVKTGADIVAGTRIASGAGGVAVPFDPAATPAQVPLGVATADAVSGAAVPVQLNLG